MMLSLLKKKQNKDVNKNHILSNQDELSLSKVIITSLSWKEWTNSIYSYNKQNIKLSAYKDKLVNYLFKSFFNLTKKILQKRRRFNPKRFSANRLYLSEAEIKHTNTNVNITLFIFNKNKNYIKHKLNRLYSNSYKTRNFKWSALKNKLVKVFAFNFNLFKTVLSRQIRIFFNHIKSKIINRINMVFNLSSDLNLRRDTKNKLISIIKKNIIEKEKNYNYWKNMFISLINKKKNKKLISNKFITILNKKNLKMYKYLYHYQSLLLNKNKFANWFLNYRSFGLINIISKIYNKKVEFNIVNLKSIHLNSNIYSESIALKLRNRNNKLFRVLKKALFKIKLPRLFDLYNIDKKKFGFILSKKDVLNSMKYKLVSGVRFEASGRLTRRLIASRAIFKLRYVGSLKNIYSSYVGLSSVMLRGYLKSSIQYTMINSKTRNGAFGLKGWTSSY